MADSFKVGTTVWAPDPRKKGYAAAKVAGLHGKTVYVEYTPGDRAARTPFFRYELRARDAALDDLDYPHSEDQAVDYFMGDPQEDIQAAIDRAGETYDPMILPSASRPMYHDRKILAVELLRLRKRVADLEGGAHG